MDVVAHEPARAPRLLALGAAVLLVAGVGAVTAVRRAGHRPAAAAPAASPSPSPSPSSPALVGLPPGLPKPPPEDPRTGEWALPALAEKTDLLLVGAGDALRTLRVDERDLLEVTLPGTGSAAGGRRAVPLARLSGGWLLARDTTCRALPCPTSTVYVALFGRKTVSLGRALDVDLDPAGDTVWVTRGSDDENATRVERMTLDGKRIGSAVPLRPDERVVGAMPDTLVVTRSTVAEAAVTTITLGYGNRTVVTGAGRGLAVAGDAIAWTSTGCNLEPAEACALSVTSLTDGRTRSIPVSGPVTLAAFDPSGRYLAAAFLYGDAGQAVRVYDLDTGEAHGTGLTYPPLAGTLTWSPNGWLVATHPRAAADGEVTSHQVALWRVGLTQAYEAEPFEGPDSNAFVALARPW